MKKTILITGATDGIGKATAMLLASKGYEVIAHARSVDKGEKVVAEIQRVTNNPNITFVTADFTSLSEIAGLVSKLNQRITKLDVLLNNAGVYREEKNILPNGLEETFMVNHLANFYLTLQLLPLLEKTGQARIVNVASSFHASSIDFDNLQGEKWYSGSSAYSLSKLCNILFTNKLAADLKESNVTVNAVHPGEIRTKLMFAGWGPMGEHPENAAKRLAYLAVDKDVKGVSGKFFSYNRPTRSSSVSHDLETMEKLWQTSAELIKLQGF